MMNVTAGRTSDLEVDGKQGRLRRLEADNVRLQRDNEMLLNTVIRMNVALNRLLEHYVVEEGRH
ncbi:hypothetical protein D3Z51_10375 [Clostridiaceae bacterium]|nr:hypothetical protein [Clostridiaceae bacterium]RKI13863.1 hypothetical protein D7V81_09860 [bacterium 1XD21-70]